MSILGKSCPVPTAPRVATPCSNGIGELLTNVTQTNLFMATQRLHRLVHVLIPRSIN